MYVADSVKVSIYEIQRVSDLVWAIRANEEDRDELKTKE